MNMISGMDFLASISGAARAAQAPSSAERTWKIGTVSYSGSWPNDKPQVTFDGETTLSGKKYSVVSGYYPRGGDRVVLAPVGTTFVIVGPLDSTAWGVREDGRIIWGSGSGPDANLYRLGPAVLRSDSTLVAGGTRSVASTANTAAIGTGGAVVATITNFVFKPGVAYEARFKTWGSSDTGARKAHFRLYKNDPTGLNYGEYGRYLLSSTGALSDAPNCEGSLYLIRDAATDLSTTVVLHVAANAGTVTLQAAAGFERYFIIRPVGPAADYLGTGVTVT